jgi:peptide/nickel transport system substrate-binding protein
MRMRVYLAALFVVFGVVLAGCGGSSSTSSSQSASAPAAGTSTSSIVANRDGTGAISTSGFQSPMTESLACVKRGGTLRVLDERPFESLDPGRTYYSVDYAVVYATQRPLYSRKPDFVEPSPDMASGQPEISANNETVTVHLKEGIHFSPPVNREVRAEDVAYAIERGASLSVANPYFQSYFQAIEGARMADGGPIKGIETPNKHEIVLHLDEPKGQLVADALVLPLSAPVPKEYAEKFDRKSPSVFGSSEYADYQVATGPYMLENNAQGKVLGIGYIPGKSVTLVRNPNWNPRSDFRPACLDKVEIKIGGAANAAIGRRVLEGSDMVESEPPAQSSIELAAQHYRTQLEISPGAASHYIAVNNQAGVFSNIDLRKALWAALDRQAMDRVRGGELLNSVATHFIYPTINGFEQAGGYKGPTGSRFAFNQYPEGNMKVAENYMKLAGYRSGKYTGVKTVVIVGASAPLAKEDAEIVNQTLKSLGFATKFSLVETSTMYSNYCNVPQNEIDVCPSVSWLADFADPQTLLNVTFNGKFISRTGNVNWGQTDVPKINAEMDRSEDIVGTAARATAWAKIDDELVEDAVAIPFDWEKEGSIESSDVHGVGQLWNEGAWDYGFTSLK